MCVFVWSPAHLELFALGVERQGVGVLADGLFDVGLEELDGRVEEGEQLGRLAAGASIVDDDVVGGHYLELLAQALDAIADVAQHALVHHGLVGRDVEQHDDILVEVGLVLAELRGRVALGQQLDVVERDLVAVEHELAGVAQLLHVAVAHLLDQATQRAHLVLGLDGKDGKVGLGLHLNAVLVATRRQLEVLDVELLEYVRAHLDDGVAHARVVLDDDDELAQRVTQRHGAPVADHTTQQDDLLHDAEELLDVGVDERLVGLRYEQVVNARVLELIAHIGAQVLAQALVHGLGEEGHKRRAQASHEEEHVEERVERQERVAVGIAAVAAQTPPVESHVPVAQRVDELDEPGQDDVELVERHLLAHELDQALHGGEYPLVHDVGARVGANLLVDERALLLALPALHVLHQELESVVPGQEGVLDDVLDACLVELERVAANSRRGDQVEADAVRAVLAYDVARVGVVLLALAHLLAVAGEHEAVGDEALKRRLVEQRRRDDEQRVEPAARLVDALGDEVGRKVRLELLLPLERIVHLRVRHAARLEPTVEHLLLHFKSINIYIVHKHHRKTLAIKINLVFKIRVP